MIERWVQKISEEIQIEIKNYDLNKLRTIKKVKRRRVDFFLTTGEIEELYKKSKSREERIYYNNLNILLKLRDNSSIKKKLQLMISLSSTLSEEDLNWEYIVRDRNTRIS